jgi:hypothetical protein
MRKIILHASGIGLAVCGLAVALAPAAGATTLPAAKPVAKTVTRPITQTISFPTAYNVNDPCDGALVSTTGHGGAVTVTTGQHTTAAISDTESGGGFTLVEVGAGTFNALSSSYSVSAEGIWIDKKDPAKSFHIPLTVTLNVTSTNAPYGFSSYYANANDAKCGV